MAVEVEAEAEAEVEVEDECGLVDGPLPSVRVRGIGEFQSCAALMIYVV